MSRLFAALNDRLMASSEEAGLRDIRAELLAQAEGETLEVGAGTGLNVEHYDRSRVTRLVLSEPDPHMARRLRGRAAAAGAEVVEAGADRLPFDDASFDTVAETLVLCTVPDPDAALAEIARVLRPGGRFLFFEHVRDDDPGVARWQDRLERPWGWIAAGCHPNRDTVATLRASPLEVEAVHDARLPKAPKLVRPAVSGSARRAGEPAPTA
jgi:ubiquinone/menaquinone biosynthesis C-methylase UbiE